MVFEAAERYFNNIQRLSLTDLLVFIKGSVGQGQLQTTLMFTFDSCVSVTLLFTN